MNRFGLIFNFFFHIFKIVSIFTIPISLDKFIGYTIAALLLELNTVFLHFRFILVFNNVDKNSIKYKLVSMMNMSKFLT